MDIKPVKTEAELTLDRPPAARFCRARTHRRSIDVNDIPETPYLLTPGPLTTSAETKRAMLRDWGSRDGAFIELNARVRRRLLEIAGVAESHTAVPVQGSGTFAVEAMLGTLVAPGEPCLVLANGAYGARMVEILRRAGREAAEMVEPEDRPIDPGEVDARLRAEPEIRHVAVVQCETTSGILNPIEEIAEVVAGHGRTFLVDAMSAFGALPLGAGPVPFDALAASANKCLEGVPGFGFVICRTDVLAGAEGRAHSLSLDLHAQWRGFEANAQWRFTPPTHVLAAFDQALVEHASEGGVQGRGGRYAENCRILVDGMRGLGFETLLPDALQAPIIVTFLMPADPAFDFQRFYDRLGEKGFLIYPGKLTVADSFRIGCIGRLGPEEMRAALRAIEETLAEMGVEDPAPA